MAFESLTDRLNGVFKNCARQSKLTGRTSKLPCAEVRMALLEADVNFLKLPKTSALRSLNVPWGRRSWKA